MIGHLQILSAMGMDFELLLGEKVKGTLEITHVYIYIPKGRKGVGCCCPYVSGGLVGCHLHH